MPIELQTNISLECEPVAPEHLVNIKWVQEHVAGKIKAPVTVVSTVDIPGTYTAGELELTATGPLKIDGVTVANGQRVLLVGQSDASENGIYVVTDAGNGGAAVLTRAPDFNDISQMFTGVTVTVNSGDNHANTTWRLVTDPIVAGGPLEWILTTPATGTAKFWYEIEPDGTETSWEIEHNLGTTGVVTQIENLTTKGLVFADVTTIDGNTVEVSFCKAPSAAEGPYGVTVIG